VNVSGVVWLDEIVEKLERKHSVSTDEVEDLFSGQPHVRFVEKGLRAGENLYSALGQTEDGRYLIVFFVRKSDGRALIISARDMTAPERKRYERR
jgi:uncharacterized DUF497 family protein